MKNTVKHDLVFALTQENAFLFEVSFWSQQKENRFLYKMVLGIFNILAKETGIYMCDNHWRFLKF